MHPRHKHRKYTNLTILALTIVATVLLFRNESVHSFLLSLGSFGYLSAFLAGAMFVSIFTAAIGAVMILVLAEGLSAVELGLIAGAGAVLTDFLIFKFIKDNLLREIVPIYDDLGGGHLTKLLHTKYFSWTLPVIGATIIASPLPDEIGVSLLGLSKMPTWKFLIISFILNAVGIFLIVSASTVIKP